MKVLTAAFTLLALVACASSTSTKTSAVAPRGTIAFGRVSANSGEHIFTIRADGTGEKQVVATTSCCGLWSHKGDRLLLAVTVLPSPTTAIMNADGSNYRVLPLDSSGLNLGPVAWSSDDSRIAFAGWDDGNPSRNGIYAADATDGGNPHRLTTTTAAQHDVPISYSPDGSKILFWRGPADFDQPGRLFLVGVNGGDITQVSPSGMTVRAGFPGDPGSWSPDGAQISFAASSPTASDPGRSAVFVAAGDGTNPKQISDWREYTTSARWSPTGDWIVFDKINPTAVGHSFYLVHPNGSGTKTVPSLAGVCCAVWSPDGDRLLFPKFSSTSSSGQDLGDLWTVAVDGSHLTQVTHTPAELTDIRWSAATS